MEGNKEAWSEYCIKRKLLKEKIREKRRILNESYMQSINERYRKNKNEFWKLSEQLILTLWCVWFINYVYSIAKYFFKF